jgi:hypothetical protein
MNGTQRRLGSRFRQQRRRYRRHSHGMTKLPIKG